MRLIPTVFKQLHQLPWRGAVTRDDYQRLSLRFYLSVLWLMLPFAAGVAVYIASTLLIANPAVVTTINIVQASVGVTILIWLVYVATKMQVLRLRNLGFTTTLTVVILAVLVGSDIVSSVANYIQGNPLLVLTGMVPYRILPLLPFIKLAGFVDALYTYLTYFETQPLGRARIPVTGVFKTPPSRFENAMLFLLQTWIYFSILSVPLHFVFNY